MALLLYFYSSSLDACSAIHGSTLVRLGREAILFLSFACLFRQWKLVDCNVVVDDDALCGRSEPRAFESSGRGCQMEW